MQLSGKRILLLSPHTDDVEYGLGGTLKRLLNTNPEVKWIVFSNAVQSLLKPDPNILIREQKQTLEFLGLKEKNLEIHDFPVRKLNYHRQEILDILIREKNSYDPDLVFCPCTVDHHQDHQVINAEARRAFKHVTLLGYNLTWNQFEEKKDLICELTKEDLEFKMKLLSIYKSQKHRKYMDPDLIETVSRFYALRTSFKYAESFEIISMVCEKQ